MFFWELKLRQYGRYAGGIVTHLENVFIDQKVLKQMKKYGFFYVTQIPDYDSYKELELLKQFFNLPTVDKYKGKAG